MSDFTSILQEKVQAYIEAHLHDDITRVILSKSPFKDVDSRMLAQQIDAKRKAKLKLPTWFNSHQIIYPKNINLQQSSSEQTANYKTEQIQGDKIADLTGGFGIDTYAFSRSFSQVDHIEKNSELSEIMQQNMSSLGVKNVKCHNTTAAEFLKAHKGSFSYLFIDPSRRDASQKKVFRLEDCEPDLTTELDFYLTKANQIYIKTSPLLDLDLGIQQLQNVHSIAIVAVQNEVKELLWRIGQKPVEDIQIQTVNFKSDSQEVFDLKWSERHCDYSNFGQPEESNFLYEPNASLMKSGAFQYISKHFSLQKIAQNTHLYFSKKQVKDFPGREFKIKQLLPYKPKKVKAILGGQKANLSTRNFPVKVDDIKKKYKIKDGGKTYVFLTTTLSNEKIVLISEKIN